MLSVCMQVKNEEMFIRESLESVKDIASEIIVVNNGSTDKTREILVEFGCIIIDSPNTTLDEGRNIYIANASYPWILVLDADERIEKINKEYLYNILEHTGPNIWAFNVRSFQYYGNGEWADVGLVRLFRNNNQISYNSSKIHTSIVPSILENNAEIDDLRLYMHHVDILTKNRTKFKREKYKKAIEETIENIEVIGEINYLYKVFYSMEFIAEKDYTKASHILKEVLLADHRYLNFAKTTLFRLFITSNDINSFELSFLPEKIKWGSRLSELYDQIDFNVYYQLFIKNNASKAKYYYRKLINLNKARPSDFLNLANLVRNIKLKSKYINSAIEMNSYLLKEVIYGVGEEPNLFKQQTCFISDINIKELVRSEKEII